jgi:uncharacterized protein YegP (UPF0339 family)
MSKSKDQYRLGQVSTNGAPGFESFKNEDDKLHYFHFNDENGEALLFSQGYQSAKNRDLGIVSLRKNVERVERRQVKQQHFFVVLAANQQEIGRSKNFTSSSTLENGLAQFHALMAEHVGITNTEPQPKTESDSEKSAARNSSSSKRYHFTLEWQERGEGEALLGLISYPLEQQKASFLGLDFAAIQAFTQSFLPVKDQTPVQEERNLSSKKKNVALPPVVEILKHDLEIQGKGQNTTKNLVALVDTLAVQVVLKPQPKENEPFTLSLSARNFDTNESIKLFHISSLVGKDGKIEVHLPTEDIPDGDFLLNSKIDLMGETTALKSSYGSKAVSFYR